MNKTRAHSHSQMPMIVEPVADPVETALGPVAIAKAKLRGIKASSFFSIIRGQGSNQSLILR